MALALRADEATEATEAFDPVDPADPAGDGSYRAQVDELRCHRTSWLREERLRVVREARRLKLREVAIIRVLDERDALDPVPDAQVPERVTKATLRVARALDEQPAIADAAQAGAMSWEQLEQVTRFATPDTDAEWARRAPNTPPQDLARKARRARRVHPTTAERRMAARELVTWRDAEAGMVLGRFRLPDVDGVFVEGVLDRIAETYRPKPGEAWDTLAHRKADALVALCRGEVPDLGSKPFVNIHVRPGEGEEATLIECDGFALAPEVLDAILPNAEVIERVDDEYGVAITKKRRRPGLPKRLEAAIVERDPHCRIPGCDRTQALQIHHLVPCCRGGLDTIDNLARVCPVHHRMLEPHGPWRLIGDPNQIDGLRLVHRDDTTTGGEAPDARAGPGP